VSERADPSRRQAMPAWEVGGRVAIFDLINRYNAEADRGHFAQALELFSDGATFEVGKKVWEGKKSILAMMESTSNRIASNSEIKFYRHVTSTHQIDFASETQASGRCYLHIVTDLGLDHWGRYIDRFANTETGWLFSARRVVIDGWSDPGGRL